MIPNGGISSKCRVMGVRNAYVDFEKITKFISIQRCKRRRILRQGKEMALRDTNTALNTLVLQFDFFMVPDVLKKGDYLPRSVLLVVQLIKEDHELRKGVSAPRIHIQNGLNECGDVPVNHKIPPYDICSSLPVSPTEIMKPKNVVYFGLFDHSLEFGMKLLVDQISDIIRVGEPLSGQLLHDPIPFFLRVILLGAKTIVQRKPDQS